MAEYAYRVRAVGKSGVLSYDATPYATLNDALNIVRKEIRVGFMATAMIERQDGKLYSWPEVQKLLGI